MQKIFLKNSRLLFDRELTFEQTALQKMSDDVFGLEVKYFEGALELHGRFDAKILVTAPHSPYKYAPTKQKSLGIETTTEFKLLS